MAGEKLVCFDFDDTLVNGHFHASLANGSLRQNIPKTPPNISSLGVQVLQPNGAFIRYHGDPQGNQFTDQGVAPKNQGASPELIQHMIQQIGLKNPQQVAQAMKQAIDNGHKVAVTSFTLYPEVAVPTLKAILGSIMSPQEAERYVQQICVVGGYPTNGVTSIGPADFYGKEEHIQAAMKHFQRQGIQFKRADVMLVDDSEPNLRLAKQYGGPSVVEVPKTPNPSLLQNNYFNDINQHVGVNVRSQVTHSTPLQQNAFQQSGLANSAWSVEKRLDFPNMRDGSLYLAFNTAVDAQKAVAAINATYGAGACRISAITFDKGASFKHVKLDVQTPNGQKAIKNVLAAFNMTEVPKFQAPLSQQPQPTPQVQPQQVVNNAASSFSVKDIQDATHFLQNGNYQNIASLKDLKFGRSLGNYSFSISEKNGAYFANINSHYGNEDKSIPITQNDIQNMAQITRAANVNTAAPVQQQPMPVVQQQPQPKPQVVQPIPQPLAPQNANAANQQQDVKPNRAPPTAIQRANQFKQPLPLSNENHVAAVPPLANASAPTQQSSPQDLKDATLFLQKGNYQNIPALVAGLKDVRLRGIENYHFSISEQNGTFTANIDSHYLTPNEKGISIPLSVNDIQNMAQITRAANVNTAAPVQQQQPQPKPQVVQPIPQPLAPQNANADNPQQDVKTNRQPPTPIQRANQFKQPLPQVPQQPQAAQPKNTAAQLPPIVKPQGSPPNPTVQQLQNAQNQAPKMQIPQPIQPPPTFQPPPQTFKPPTDQAPPLMFAAPQKATPTVQQVEPPSFNYGQQVSLNLVLNMNAKTLSEQYQNFNATKHHGDKTIQSLFNIAKTAAKHINGTASLREQQTNDIHNVFSAIKKDDKIPNDFKAALAFAYLESVKDTLGNQSGMKDLCKELQSKIEQAVPGTTKYYIENDAALQITKTATNIIKEPPPKPESTGNKLK
jgi:hypothetical protein